MKKIIIYRVSNVYIMCLLGRCFIVNVTFHKTRGSQECLINKFSKVKQLQI